MKKVFIILIIILSITIVVFLGWYFLLRSPDTSSREAIRNILPFGEVKDINQPTISNPEGQQATYGARQSTTTDESSIPTANLFRISDTPVAGSVVLTKNARVITRYVDRATGHIYDVDLATLEKTKITNNTLPKIYEAYFRPDGNAVLLRSLKDDSDTIVNLSLALTAPLQTASTTLYTISSTPIRGDIGVVAVGSGNTLFYTLKDTSSIVSSAFNGTGAKIIFKSPFTDWRLAMAGNSLVIYTKASANASGYAYTVNTSNGALAKIFGPLNGLVVVPNNSGSRMLYSYTEGGGTRLFANNLQNKTFSEISPGTLAEKCTWGTKNAGLVFCSVPTDRLRAGEPDNWYRGATHFSDRVWLFDTNTDTAQVLVEPKQSFDVDIDVFEPRLSPNEDYFIFTNKNDLSLWALKLE